jgi:hypothetical protein
MSSVRARRDDEDRHQHNRGVVRRRVVVLNRLRALQPSEAAANVDYRMREGDFHVLEDLKKVPGLDFPRIEERKNRIVFTGD